LEDIAVSKDGYVVTLRLERRYSKSVGADFVTGGLHDYRSTTKEGFYLTVRGSSTDAKKLIECIRSSIKSLTGNFPSVMPPAKASGIIEFIFDSTLSEAEIMNSIMSAISVTELGVSLLAHLTPKRILNRKRISTKEQEPSFAPPRRIRPIGVSVISVTWIVIGFLDALVGIIAAVQLTYSAYSSSFVTRPVLVAIGGLAYIVGGLGLLSRKSWAYRYNIILCVISTILLISVWVGIWVVFLFMILNIFALSYLIRPSTRTFFSAKYTEPPIRYGSKKSVRASRLALTILVTIVVVSAIVYGIYANTPGIQISNAGYSCCTIRIMKVTLDNVLQPSSSYYYIVVDVGYSGSDSWAVNPFNFQVISDTGAVYPVTYSINSVNDFNLKSVILQNGQHDIGELAFQLGPGQVPVTLEYITPSFQIQAHVPPVSSWVSAINPIVDITVKGPETSLSSIYVSGIIQNYTYFFRTGDTIAVKLTITYDLFAQPSSIRLISVSDSDGFSILKIQPALPATITGNYLGSDVIVYLSAPATTYSGDLHLTLTFSY
jgi:hypothetical protein